MPADNLVFGRLIAALVLYDGVTQLLQLETVEPFERRNGACAIGPIGAIIFLRWP